MGAYDAHSHRASPPLGEASAHVHAGSGGAVSSFRALAGYEDAIGETARLTDRRIERGEEERHRLDAILRQLECRLAEKPTVTVTYFRPDDWKAGGAYFAA